MRVPRADFVFFDAGGGHRSAATALKEVTEAQRPGWQIRLVDLQDVLDDLDVIRKLTGIRMEDVYNRLLQRGWTLGAAYLVPPMHGLIRLFHRAQVERLAQFWQPPPDIVVSLIPNFNRALYEGLRRVSSTAPFVTILTDFADYPPHFWMERQPQYFVCGTDKAVQQALAMGHPAERVFRVSGMILRPAFYQAVQADRRQERSKLGLDPDLPTGCVLFGGHGSPAMLRIARRLNEADLRAQFIFMAGKNTELESALRRLDTNYPKAVLGFTTQVPFYMYLSDFFIGKPGPGSISEALAMGLPVIVERNAWTLPQERYNCQWVEEKGVGVVLHSFGQIGPAIRRLLENGQLDSLRERVRGIQNRAVFEIPAILETILEAQCASGSHVSSG